MSELMRRRRAASYLNPFTPWLPLSDKMPRRNHQPHNPVRSGASVFNSKHQPMQLLTSLILIMAATMFSACSSVSPDFRDVSCADYECVRKTLSHLAVQE